MTATKEISVNADIAADLAELDGIYAFKTEQKNDTNVFPRWTMLFFTDSL